MNYQPPFKPLGPTFNVNTVGLSWATVNDKQTAYQFTFRATLGGLSVADLVGMNPKGFIVPPYYPMQAGELFNHNIEDIIILN